MGTVNREPEQMTIEMAERMINDAYNDVTFKNALVCVLDWLNWYHCTHVHKDTKIGVDENGYRIDDYKKVPEKNWYKLSEDTSVVANKDYFEEYDHTKHKFRKVDAQMGDNPVSEGWYEYKNPNSIPWFEKIKTDISYSEVAAKEVNYDSSPKWQGWYERDQLTSEYYVSTDLHCTGTYVELTNPSPGLSPKDMGWYEWDVTLETYLPSEDHNIQSGKTYYMCVYKTYYKQIQEKVNRYEITQDTVVNPSKTYFVQQNVDHYIPEDESEWDYSDHYQSFVSTDVPGVESEVTLQNKRPALLGG